jgi:hypothetical protein
MALTAAEWILARFFLDSMPLRALTGFGLGAVVAPFIRLGVEQMFARFAHESM